MRPGFVSSMWPLTKVVIYQNSPGPCLNAYGTSLRKTWRAPLCRFTNIPGADARTSTIMPSNVTLPYGKIP